MTSAEETAPGEPDGSAGSALPGHEGVLTGQAVQARFRDVPERWPVTASEEMARGTIVTLRSDQVRMPDGEVAERQVVQHPGAVAVVALDKAGQVLMIRQYRHPVGRLLWELPAGLRDIPGEPPRATAERELLEETGYRARDWHVLVDFFSSPGISTERIRVFLARDLSCVPPAERDHVPAHEEAQLLLSWVTLDEAVDRFTVGDLHNGVTAVGILSAYAARRSGFDGLRPADAPED
ncbi:MAG TPA: NUDIX hydrolase [Streptosporangiaceae bacterium]|nr:NUDIX hydrolase [Streptosporangiaceae bacterium]